MSPKHRTTPLILKKPKLNMNTHDNGESMTGQEFIQQLRLDSWVDFFDPSLNDFIEARINSKSDNAISLLNVHREELVVSKSEALRRRQIRPFHSIIADIPGREQIEEMLFVGLNIRCFDIWQQIWSKGIVKSINYFNKEVTVSCAYKNYDFDFPFQSVNIIYPCDEMFLHTNIRINILSNPIKRTKNWDIEKIEEDGNCVFRSVSHQIYGDQSYHHIIRQKCVDYLIAEKDYFKDYITEDKGPFESYCEKMRLPGQWGDHIEIQILSELYGRPVEVYDFGAVPLHTFPNIGSKFPIRLHYQNNNHYNSILPLAAPPLDESPGSFEDCQISLVSLRSLKSHQEALKASDIEATEKVTLDATLEKSRADFQKYQSLNSSSVIYEKDSLLNVKHVSDPYEIAKKATRETLERDLATYCVSSNFVSIKDVVEAISIFVEKSEQPLKEGEFLEYVNKIVNYCFDKI